MENSEGAVHSFQSLCVGWGVGWEEEQESGRDGSSSALETSMKPRFGEQASAMYGTLLASLAHPVPRPIPYWEVW